MTKVEIALPGQAGADALALPVTQPPGGDGAKIVDAKLGGRLGKLGESGDLRGERGEAVLLHLNGELEAPRLVAAGVGKRDEVDADALRTAAAATAQALARVGGTLVWLLDETLPVPLPEQAAALVEGTILGAYSPGRWKSRPRQARSSGSSLVTPTIPSCRRPSNGQRSSPSGRTARATSRTCRRTS